MNGPTVNDLLAKIGALVVDNDFLRAEIEQLRSEVEHLRTTWTPPMDDVSTNGDHTVSPKPTTQRSPRGIKSN